MLNKYLEDAFKLSKTHNATFEEVKQDWRDGCKTVRVDFHGGTIDFPLNVDMYGVEGKSFKNEEDFTFKLALFYENDGEVFKDEAEYYAEKKRRFSAESVIPCGTFDPKCREDFQENTTAIFIGKIVSVEHVVLDDVKSLHIVFTCQGEEYDYFIDEGIMPFVDAGNIISGIFYVAGLV